MITPALYSAYEREYQESQLEHRKKKKGYEEHGTARALVAPCDDRVSCICCRDGSGESNADGCYEKGLADAFTTSFGMVSGLGTHKKGG